MICQNELQQYHEHPPVSDEVKDESEEEDEGDEESKDEVSDVRSSEEEELEGGKPHPYYRTVTQAQLTSERFLIFSTRSCLVGSFGDWDVGSWPSSSDLHLPRLKKSDNLRH